MAIQWTTCTYDTAKDATARAALWHTIGLDTYFDISYDTNQSGTATAGTDYFYPKSGNGLWFTFTSLNTSGLTAYIGYIGTVYNNVKNTSNQDSGSNNYLESTNYITIKKGTVGNTVIFLIDQPHTSGGYNGLGHKIVIAIDTGTSVDDGTTAVTTVYSGFNSYNSTAYSNANRYILTNSKKYENTSAAMVSIVNLNMEYSQKLVLTPLYFGGAHTNFYSIDGGLTRVSPQQYVVVDGHEFFTLGQGLAVKVQ